MSGEPRHLVLPFTLPLALLPPHALTYKSRPLLTSPLPPPTMSTYHVERDVDMTQPTSSIMKTGTRKLHDEIGKSKGASTLTKGELDREEYTRYLMMLWHIYKYVFSSTLSIF